VASVVDDAARGRQNSGARANTSRNFRHAAEDTEMVAGKTSSRRVHRFGGDWTSSKLDVLANYLASYTTALKDKPSAGRPFRKAYIDAFAGTGYRAERGDQAGTDELLFPDLAEDAAQRFLDGSARLALKTNPRFDCYIFIERNHDRCGQLEGLKQEFPALAADVTVLEGDANVKLQSLCEKDWRLNRAVLFLDPYGMQVEWKTIEAVAATKAIDLWVLFPLGIGVNRLLTRSGDIPIAWRQRLDKLLGTTDWYDEFYRVESEVTLFGTSEERVVKAGTAAIGEYFNSRLRSVFADVAAEPKVLRNSTKCPLYLLCFAVGNDAGAPIALRIANHLLRTVQ
jgi:three-Cys-motif partner protein